MRALRSGCAHRVSDGCLVPGDRAVHVTGDPAHLGCSAPGISGSWVTSQHREQHSVRCTPTMLTVFSDHQAAPSVWPERAQVTSLDLQPRQPTATAAPEHSMVCNTNVHAFIDRQQAHWWKENTPTENNANNNNLLSRDQLA